MFLFIWEFLGVIENPNSPGKFHKLAMSTAHETAEDDLRKVSEYTSEVITGSMSGPLRRLDLSIPISGNSLCASRGGSIAAKCAVVEATNISVISSTLMEPYGAIGVQGNFDDLALATGIVRPFRPRAAKASMQSDEDDDLIVTDQPPKRRGSTFAEVCLFEVMILSRVDDISYKAALENDAMLVHHRFFFPNSFPWHETKLELEMTMPFDVEDLPGVLHAKESNYYLCTEYPHRSISAHKSVSFEWDDECQGLYKSCILERCGFFSDYGRFEIGRCRRPRDQHGQVNVISKLCGNDIVCLTRRGVDPGILELFVCLLFSPISSMPQIKSAERKWAELFYSTSTLPWSCDGEYPNPVVHQSKTDKRLRRTNDFLRTIIRRFKLSVKVGGVSSRSHLFPDLCSGLEVLELKRQKGITIASFPSNIQSHKQNSTSNVNSLQLNDTALRRPSDASSPGRHRLVWSEPGTSQFSNIVGNSFYKRVLTGQTVEGSQGHKRPRLVAVRIRLNTGCCSEFRSNVNGSSTESGWQNTMCTFDPNSYLESFVRNSRKHVINKLGLKEQNRRSSSVRFEAFTSTPPVIVAIPCDEGALRVICLRPGNIVPTDIHNIMINALEGRKDICCVCWSKTNHHTLCNQVMTCFVCNLPMHVDCCYDSGGFNNRSSLNDLTLKGSEVSEICWTCPVCWVHGQIFQDDGSDPGIEQVLQQPVTKMCNLSPLSDKFSRRRTKLPAKFEDTRLPSYLNRRTLSSRGTQFETQEHDQEIVEGSANTCSQPQITDPVCLRKILPCTLCPHFGGAMSRISYGQSVGGWTHEVCRIWADSPHKIEDHSMDAICCYCGNSQATGSSNHEKVSFQRRVLVKCAAKGCHITFHPMCALILSKSTNKTNSHNEDADLEIASRPSLHFCETGIKNPISANEVLPVAFCGWHNPSRNRSLYGFPPVPNKKLQSQNFNKCFNLPVGILNDI